MFQGSGNVRPGRELRIFFIGWSTAIVFVALLLRYKVFVVTLALAGAIAAGTEWLVLSPPKLGRRLERGVPVSLFWGGLAGCAVVAVEMILFPLFRAHPIGWLLAGFSTGAIL